MTFRHNACLLFFLIAPGMAVAAGDDETRDIRNILEEQQTAWNRGDINAFMNGYWQSNDTVFVSGDRITRGWQPVLDRYRKSYSDRDKMGTLTFSELDIHLLSADAALVDGRWSVRRKTNDLHGRFSLIFRKMADGWRIVHDHTSAAD